MKSRLLLALTCVLAIPVASRSFAAQVGFAIVESYDVNGVEIASAYFTSDPSAVVVVTREPGSDGEVWLIDLTLSGHVVPGFTWPGGFTQATWVEPEHPGTYNNVYILDNQHMRMESEWPTATGQNLGNYPGGFGNGVSYYAGNDVNGDQIFVSVTEAEAAVPVKPTTWGGIKALYH